MNEHFPTPTSPERVCARSSEEKATVRVLFNEQQIAKRIQELAHLIAAKHPKDLLVVGILKGSFVFIADLIRALHHANLSPQVEFIHLSSYQTGTRSSGHVSILRDIQSSIEGRDVMLIDDILESGRTLAFAKELMLERGAQRVLCTVLLEKPHKKEMFIKADFVGFTCPDEFVIGYGMDFAHNFRQLPFIGTLDHCPETPRTMDGNTYDPPAPSL
jgi:hypoxanthine phosphoribosyltransferase